MKLLNTAKEYFVSLWKKGAFHIITGSFLTKFVAFFGSIFLVRALSKESYGLLGYIENIYGYVYIFAGLGLGNMLLRYVILGKNKDEKFTYFKYSIKYGTIFNVILALILTAFFMFYPHPKEFESAKFLLIVLLWSLPFQYLSDSNALSYRAMLDNKRYAMVAFITSVSLIATRYFGAVLFDLTGVIVGRLLVYAIFGVVLIVSTYKLYFNKAKEIELTKEQKKEANNFSLQYMVTNGIWAIFMLNDVFFLSRLTGDASIVADYKVAYVLPGNLSVISTAIGIFIGPYFTKYENNLEWVWQNYKKVLATMTAAILPIVLIIFVFAGQLITLLYGDQYLNIVPLMRLLLISSFLNSAIRYTTAHVLSSMGQIKYNLMISIFGIVLQIILNMLLIPMYGSNGAAFTSILVYALMAGSLIFIFVRKYKIKN